MYKRILRFLNPHIKIFIFALLCMVIFGATDGGVPFLIKYILDGVFSRKDADLLKLLPIIIVIFALIRGFADFGQQYLISKVGLRVIRDIRNKINAHLIKMSPAFFVEKSVGQILATVTGDVVLVRTLVTDTAAAVIRDLIRVVALFIAAIYLDPFLAIMSVTIFPVAGIPIARIGKKMRRLAKKGQDGIGNISSVLQESMLGNRVVKIFCREIHEENKFQNENEDLTKTLIKSEKVRAFAGPLNEVLASLAISGVLLYGGYSVIKGDRTQGDFIAFLLSVFLLYDPFKRLTRIHSTVQQGMASAQRIFEVLDTPPLITEPVQSVPLPRSNEISLKNVVFFYRKDQQTHLALDNISLIIPEGKKTALVGFSGSGKSTLVDLIPRFIDPVQGTVSLGGVNIRDLSLNGLRSRLTMVSQHTFLFHDTIYNNIAYGNPMAKESDVLAAAKTAFAYDFIVKLPNGFETVIGESGMMLSGGERQRVAIARAILKNSPILILDEATASLDNRSEREVQLALQALESGRTTIVVAHRLSTIVDADQIIVMSAGKIVESGKHEDLLKLEGEYFKLYNLQGRGEGPDNSFS